MAMFLLDMLPRICFAKCCHILKFQIIAFRYFKLGRGYLEVFLPTSAPVSVTSNSQHELRSKHFAREAAEWIMMACRLGDLRTGQR